MAIKIRCPECYMFNSAKNTVCFKCGVNLKNSKSFYIEYRVNKKVKREYAGINITQAKHFEVEKKYKMKMGELDVEKDILFEEYIKTIFIPHYDTKNKSLMTELSKFTAIINYFADKKLKSITSLDIENYYQYRLSINKPATAKNHLAILKRMFNYAIEIGYLQKSPVKTKSVKFDNKRIRFLSNEEKVLLLEECRKSRNSNLYNIVLIALETGMRRGEISLLNKEDIKNDVIRIKAENSKTSISRIIPLSDKLKQLFMNLDEVDFHVSIRKSFEGVLKRCNIKDLALF